MAERIGKWNARHPRVSAAGIVGTVLGAALLFSVAMLMLRQSQVAELNSASWMVQLEKAQLPSQSLLAQHALPEAEVQTLVGSLDESWVSPQAWRVHSRRLVGEERGKASQLLGQLLGYRARGQYELAQRETDPLIRKQLLDAALASSEEGSKLLLVGQEVHQSLTESIRSSISGSDQNTVTAPSPKSAKQLLEETQRLVQLDVGNPWYWWNLAQRQWATGDTHSALSAARVANIIEPGFSSSKYLTALIHLQLNEYAAAEEQLTQLIDSAKHAVAPEVLLNRAISRLAQQKFPTAKADLDAIANVAQRYPRIYFLREQAKRALGDTAGAEEDLLAGLACQPKDAMEWASRADAKLRRQPPDPAGAVEDLRQAKKIDPMQQVVYENLAFILAELLHQRSKAIEVLDEGIRHLPSNAGLFASRGVLRARSGDREKAHEDVDSALKLERGPMVCYQAASALLVASPEQRDRKRAIELLKETLSKQPTLAKMMDTDRDLESIRHDERFVTLLRAAATFQ